MGVLHLQAYALGGMLSVQEGNGLWKETVPVPGCSCGRDLCRRPDGNSSNRGCPG